MPEAFKTLHSLSIQAKWSYHYESTLFLYYLIQDELKSAWNPEWYSAAGYAAESDPRLIYTPPSAGFSKPTTTPNSGEDIIFLYPMALKL